MIPTTEIKKVGRNMIVIKQFICGVIGLGAGLATAGGVFALITVVGIIPRLAGKTRTAVHIRFYEWAIILGGTFGNIISVFRIPLPLGNVLGTLFMAIFGFGCGIFVSSLIMALAETLDVFPIMVRRIRLKVGFPMIVCGLAIGKTLGAFLYFYKGWS